MNHPSLSRRQVRRLAQEIQPDPTWVSGTRARVMKQIEKEMPFADLQTRQTAREMLGVFSPSRAMRAVSGTIMAVISTFGVILGGSIASVSAAETALPGDFLYPVKLAAEQTRLVFTKDKRDRLKLKTEFVTRRVIEMKQLAQSDLPERNARVKEATEILKRDLNTVNAQLEEVRKEVGAAEAARGVDLIAANITSELKTVKTAVGEDQDMKQKVAEAQVAAVDTGVKAIGVLLDQGQDASSTILIAEELKESLKQKVEGLKENLQDATDKLSDAGITTSTLIGFTTSTPLEVITRENVSSTYSKLREAGESLIRTERLIEENKLSEVKDALSETVKTVVNVDSATNSMIVASTTASIAAQAELPPPSAQSSTTPLVTVTTTQSTVSSTNTQFKTPTSSQ